MFLYGRCYETMMPPSPLPAQTGPGSAVPDNLIVSLFCYDYSDCRAAAAGTSAIRKPHAATSRWLDGRTKDRNRDRQELTDGQSWPTFSR